MSLFLATSDFLVLLAAIPLAALGGETFLRGVLGVKLLVATTLAAFATSSPELTVSGLAALAGKREIGLGDALGSNLSNGLAVVGVAATIHPIRAPMEEVAVALGFGVLTVLLILPRQGIISRRRGLFLLATYAAYVAATLAL